MKTSLSTYVMCLLVALWAMATPAEGKRKKRIDETQAKTVSTTQKTKVKLAGVPLTKYAILYSPEAEAEEGIEMAQSFKEKLEEEVGISLPVLPSDVIKKGYFISFVHSPQIQTFDYDIQASTGRLTIDGGGCWAMQKAAKLVIDKLKSTSAIGRKYHLHGTIEGEYLFEPSSDVTLRILDDNIWEYNGETIPDIWQKMGEDCRDDVRAPQFAQLARAYMPDIIALQEYSRHMGERLEPMIGKYGYIAAYKTTPQDKNWSYTPIFYLKDKLKLLKANYHLYTPEKWSNNATKSYTSAVFEQKEGGKRFAVISTHLWWKSDAAQPGSTEARADQARLVIAEAKSIKAEYDCPIFVVGDMNSEEGTLPVKQFMKEGFKPCYKIATEYADLNNGHHEAGPTCGFSRKSTRKGASREIGAIDHCLLYNGKQIQVKRFDCLTPYFTVKLTDHYPNLIDVVY